jgi:ribosomal protein S21
MPSKVIKVRNGNLSAALRQLKNELVDAQMFDEIRKRRFYTKPSVQKRLDKKRAIFLNKQQNKSEQKKY